MALVGEYFREIVAESIGISDSLPVGVSIACGRLVLVLRSIAHIIGGQAVETVVFLAVVFKTALYPEIQVLDDMPCHSAVHCPVPADTEVVIVGYGLERRSVVSIVFFEVRA